MSIIIDLRTKGRVYGSSASDAADASRDKISVEPYGQIAFGADGLGWGRRWLGALDNMSLLPAAAVAAGTSPYVESVGTGTEIVARAAKGGARLTTQATTPIATNECLLAGVATTGHAVLVDANTLVHFHCVLSVPAITELVVFAGLSEEPDSVLPADCGGDAVGFIFDPEEAVTTGLTTAQHANWIGVITVASVETYFATTVAVNVDEVYDLKIKYGVDRIPKGYINGVLVGTHDTAQTDAQTLRTLVGVETSEAAQKSLDVHAIEVSRAIT